MERAMREKATVETDPGAMAALMPVSIATAEKIVQQVQEDYPNSVCSIANYNSKKQARG